MNKLVVPFDYSVLDKETRGKLTYLSNEVKKLGKTHVESGLEIGRMMSEARELLGDDDSFRGWVERECGFARSSAYRYIAAYQNFGECPNLGQFEISAMHVLATNEEAKSQALKRAAKGEKITYTKAKEIVAECKPPAPPRLPSPKVEDAEFTVVETAPEAASEETGEDASKDAPGTDSPQETAPRPTRNVKEKPGDVPCPNCSNRKWTEGISYWHCTKCGHPHGEPVGDRDEDEVVDERITVKKAKTRKTIEALMREWDDLGVLVPNPKEHAEVISMCKLMLNKLKTWN